MPNKTVEFGIVRPASPTAGHFRSTGSAAASCVSPRRLSKQNRIEQERLDRYGRFGRR
jgi:hypothetical protein